MKSFVRFCTQRERGSLNSYCNDRYKRKLWTVTTYVNTSYAENNFP